MMEAERDSSVMFAGKLEANDHSYGCQPPEVWEQLQQEVVNIEVKPTIKTEDGVLFGSCGMLDMLATVATDPSYTRTRIKTEAASEILPTPSHNSHSNAAPAPRGRVGRITKLTEQDRIGYAQLSKMSLNTLLRLFTEASYDGEGKKIDRYLCRLMSPDDHFGRTNFISFNPCDFEVRAQGCSEAKAKTQMKVHLQQHIKDILNCGDHELFSAEPVAAKLRRLARVKLEWPEHHFLVPKIERVEPLIAALEQQQDFLPPAPTSLSPPPPPPTSSAISSSRCPVLVKKEPFLVLQETSIIHHDHSYAFDSTSAAVKSMPFDDQASASDEEPISSTTNVDNSESSSTNFCGSIENEIDEDEDDEANDSGAGSGEDVDRYSGFVTSDPVINLDSDVRYSVNQVPPAKVSSLPAEPKGYVPLIGSEVDVREELSQQQLGKRVAMKKKKPSQHSRNSPTSPNNSSDSGLSVSEAEQTPQVSEEKLKEQASAIEAIKDLKSKGSSTVDLVCRVCKPARDFTAYTSLLNHLQSHAGVKKFKCQICRQSFGRQQILDYHMSAVHLDEKKFTCPECKKTFRHPYHFRAHLRQHDTPIVSKSSYPVQNEADHSMEVPSDEFVPAAVSRVGLVTTVGGDTTSTASHIIPMPAVKSNLPEDKISEASSTPSVVVSSQMAAPSGPPPPPIQVPTTIHTERIMPTLATSLVKINMRSSAKIDPTKLKRKPTVIKSSEAVKIWQKQEHKPGVATYVPFATTTVTTKTSSSTGASKTKIFKDVSNVAVSSSSSSTPSSTSTLPSILHPKAILATLNGRQVLLIPKTAGSSNSGSTSAGGRTSPMNPDTQGSKLEKALRFGSASVESSDEYPVSRRTSSCNEDQETGSEQTVLDVPTSFES